MTRNDFRGDLTVNAAMKRSAGVQMNSAFATGLQQHVTHSAGLATVTADRVEAAVTRLEAACANPPSHSQIPPYVDMTSPTAEQICWQIFRQWG